MLHNIDYSAIIGTMRFWKYFAFILILSVFFLLRLFAIDKTIVLFGDSARDLLELYEWEQTRLPPLLGPHTSALSFNQSAWYFYWLMPFYLLSAHSLYTANIAVLAYYLLWLGVGIFSLQKGWLTLTDLTAVVIAITFHPELINQLRNVWNPSFVLPLTLAVSLIVTRVKWKNISTKTLAGIAFCLVMAVGLSYSIVPFALVVIGYSIIQIWQHSTSKTQSIFKLLLFFVMSVVLVNIGTIGYELKYQFLLTKNLGNQQILQISTDQLDKWQQLTTVVMQNHWLWLILILCLSFSFLLLKNNSKQTRQLEKSVTLLFFTLGITLLFPFAVHEHYIFGILALLIVVIIAMPIILQLALLLSFSLVVIGWLFSSNLFATNSPTTAEKRSCLERVCAQNLAPIYLVANTPSHDHQALEYSYLAKTTGCDAFAVTEIATQQPKTMAVFNQNANFELSKTDFYELNRFANAQFKKTMHCSTELSVSLFSFY